MIALLIFLGSHILVVASGQSGGPCFDILKVPLDNSYNITDHLRVSADRHGALHLSLSKYQFVIDMDEKRAEIQQLVNLPNLNNNAWTKEWKSSDLPIFCRAEHLIQKQSGIAFRFRLGSLDYVNALEGK